MKLETGDSIPVILSIFTVILAIIPNIIPVKTNDLPPTNLALFQATVDLSNNTSAKNSFFAKTLLHNNLNYKKFVTDDKINDSININNRINLQNAINTYNDESILAKDPKYNNTINNLNTSLFTNCKNQKNMNDICKDIWFTARLLNLEIENRTDINQDRFNCTQIIKDTHQCSYVELKNLTDINSKVKKGFINYFYNERKVTTLEKPIESFVSGINQLFISVLLSGPTILLAYINRQIPK